MNQETQSEVIEPISASVDGKRNSYCMSCATTGQSMSYAACIWRQDVLKNPGVKTPADWAPCDKARLSGTCPAVQMREEEVLAGKAIYFRDRNQRPAANRERMFEHARSWGMELGSKLVRAVTSVTPSTSRPVSRPAPVPAPKRDMLDAMGDAGSLADAITTEAATVSLPKPSAAPIPQALPGESPLQMARRIAAERAAA